MAQAMRWGMGSWVLTKQNQKRLDVGVKESRAPLILHHAGLKTLATYLSLTRFFILYWEWDFIFTPQLGIKGYHIDAVLNPVPSTLEALDKSYLPPPPLINFYVCHYPHRAGPTINKALNCKVVELEANLDDIYKVHPSYFKKGNREPEMSRAHRENVA